MKFYLTIFFCIQAIISACQNNTNRYNEFYSRVKQQFDIIDSVSYKIKYDSLTNFDEIDSLHETANKKVIEIIKEFKKDIFEFPDTLNYDALYISKSSDQQFALVSWDTRFGGTMIDFAAMSLFKTVSGVKSKMILEAPEAEGEDSSNCMYHYNSIETLIKKNGEKVYLAWGNGQGSTALPWQEVRAFSIKNGNLIQPKIFPTNESAVGVEFDLHAFDDGQTVPVIKIKNKGYLILVPDTNDKEGFSGKYERYYFNGTRYIKR